MITTAVPRFTSPLATQLTAFLAFKRTLGFRYTRAAFTLQAFDRFVAAWTSGSSHRWDRDGPLVPFEEAMRAWVASRPARQPVSAAMDVAVLRQFWKYLRGRVSGHRGRPPIREPDWPKLPTSSTFVPFLFSRAHIRHLVQLAGRLRGDRPILYRTLLLLLYCTGVRFGEALRLRLQDVDLRTGILFIRQTKGRARWVPIHRSLTRALQHYLVHRRQWPPDDPTAPFFLAPNGRPLSTKTAGWTLRQLFIMAGLKGTTGRTGPRPYDLRHAFAIHRLTRWYRAGADLQTRLPWLSAYMGHDDLLGTETYLTATPELLVLAGSRFRHRVQQAARVLS